MVLECSSSQVCSGNPGSYICAEKYECTGLNVPANSFFTFFLSLVYMWHGFKPAKSFLTFLFLHFDACRSLCIWSTSGFIALYKLLYYHLPWKPLHSCLYVVLNSCSQPLSCSFVALSFITCHSPKFCFSWCLYMTVILFFFFWSNQNNSMSRQNQFHCWRS